MVMATIRSEPQQVSVKNPPENWSVIYKIISRDEVIYRLAKWSKPLYGWIDEYMMPITGGNQYTLYEETRFKDIAQLEAELGEDVSEKQATDS